MHTADIGKRRAPNAGVRMCCITTLCSAPPGEAISHAVPFLGPRVSEANSPATAPIYRFEPTTERSGLVWSSGAIDLRERVTVGDPLTVDACGLDCRYLDD